MLLIGENVGVSVRYSASLPDYRGIPHLLERDILHFLEK